jgi:alpha-methylacyl-CoA racemase
MVDGAALLMAPIYAMLARGRWKPERGANMLDGAAPWYDTYECADGRWVAGGADRAAVLRAGGGQARAGQPRASATAWTAANWPALREALAAAFRARTRDEWAALFEGRTLAWRPCSTSGKRRAPRTTRRAAVFNRARRREQPAPAPRFDRTTAEPEPAAAAAGRAHGRLCWRVGLCAAEIAAVREAGRHPRGG